MDKTTKKHIWFKAKRYGWGWYPATWQGWDIIAAYVFALGLTFVQIDSGLYAVGNNVVVLLPVQIVLTLFLLLVCYLSGEKPRWRWGK